MVRGIVAEMFYCCRVRLTSRVVRINQYFAAVYATSIAFHDCGDNICRYPELVFHNLYAFTQQISGSEPSIIFHESPSSCEAKSLPFFVPKNMLLPVEVTASRKITS